MRVAIRMIVDIDADAWTSNYGVSGDKAIRDDVKAYVESTVYDQLEHVGVLAREGDS